MVEIEKYPCKDGNDETARERYWYEKFNCKENMNSQTPNNRNEILT